MGPGGILSPRAEAPSSLTVGDFNRDGKQDLAVISLEGTGILLGNGDGTFQPIVALALP